MLNRYFPIRKGKRSWVGGLSGQSFMWLTSFTDILLYIYVVRIENTLVMTHGIASCSFLLSFFLHSPREEKTLVFFFSSKDAFVLPFLLLGFQKAHQVSILSGKSSIVTNCSERQFYDIQQKKKNILPQLTHLQLFTF